MLDEEIEKIKKEIVEEEELFRALQEFEYVSREAMLEEEKIKVQLKAKEELEINKNEILQLSKIESEEDIKPVSNLLYNIPGIIFIISIISLFTLETPIFGSVGVLISVISFLIILFKSLKVNKQIKMHDKEIEKQRKDIENKIELIENEICAKDKLIKESEEKLVFNTKMKEDRLKEKYPNVNKVIFEGNINIIEEQNYINKLKINLSQKEYEEKSITEKLEKLVDIQEELNTSIDEYQKLVQYDEIIEIAKDALEKAYVRMKESITPKFTENLSVSIDKLTGGKYKKIKVNDEKGIILEAENGNYITASHLSQGTIDQIYLSLRISSVNELTYENMPIILDETFAYFDEPRLENVINFLNNYYDEKQIIIFTCTNREIEALSKMGINYNKIIL